jgi:hypothetical protein
MKITINKFRNINGVAIAPEQGKDLTLVVAHSTGKTAALTALRLVQAVVHHGEADEKIDFKISAEGAEYSYNNYCKPVKEKLTVNGKQLQLKDPAKNTADNPKCCSDGFGLLPDFDFESEFCELSLSPSTASDIFRGAATLTDSGFPGLSGLREISKLRVHILSEDLGTEVYFSPERYEKMKNPGYTEHLKTLIPSFISSSNSYRFAAADGCYEWNDLSSEETAIIACFYAHANSEKYTFCVADGLNLPVCDYHFPFKSTLIRTEVDPTVTELQVKTVEKLWR